MRVNVVGKLQRNLEAQQSVLVELSVQVPFAAVVCVLALTLTALRKHWPM